MFLHAFALHQDVVNICLKISASLTFEYDVNHVLIDGTGILEAEGHDVITICTEVGDESSFLFIFFSHPDLMVPGESI
ncbi:hypothetical protein AXF42_Ash019469 [Apostasia shenzhenica]|uniref:Uncharacterized protein n=1 Tax=Apostasia shenzhenica TaxID=1088818 RepID=A0A2I0AYH2_9ASPA|nr:hypothetical protein AXF42_Ash019469 [Apostasia shenzhenica]